MEHVSKTPMHNLTSIDDEIAAGGYVSVLTPTDKVHPATIHEGEGIKVGAWTSDLAARDVTPLAYYWMVCCCPCVPLAQLEVRLGLLPYRHGLARHGANYLLFLVFSVTAVVMFFQDVLHGDNLVWFYLVLVGWLLTVISIAHGIAVLRGVTRERFQIAGSPKDDRYVALLQSRRAIRQMGKHLQCDRAFFRGAPATLPSYQV